ncbi:MAG: hypothetical protein LBQ12_05685 [Deltaproteobacteria bacterium]|nr:hypothetical protein [Deltaproteobacteria bacterium]
MQIWTPPSLKRLTFLTDGQYSFFKKLSDSRGEEIKSKDEEIKSKGEELKSKDEELKQFANSVTKAVLRLEADKKSPQEISEILELPIKEIYRILWSAD